MIIICTPKAGCQLFRCSKTPNGWCYRRLDEGKFACELDKTQS
jgi:hypothetical protein